MNRYDTLGVREDAPLDEIKKAYRKLAAKTHPDRNGEEMTPLFRSVQDAYETLSDPLKRAAYDRELNKTSVPQPHPEPAAYAGPQGPSFHEADEPGYAPAAPYAESDPVQRTPREATIRKIKICLIVTVFFVAGGYWLSEEIKLWTLSQPASGVRVATFQSLPAIVYTVLWGFGALVAAVADDMVTAMKTPFGCAGVAGFFALITATGSPSDWMTAFVAGFVFTAVIALTVRLKDDLAVWLR